MRYFGNPLVWLMRFRKRRGYGVHSPFAFQFIHEVCYETLPFYAFAELDAGLPLVWRWRKRKGMHLLFRLANWFQPQVVVTPADAAKATIYIMSACCGAKYLSLSEMKGRRRLVLIVEQDDALVAKLGADDVLVVDNLQRHRAWFRSLPSVVSFDLYDMGIAFFDPRYHKEHYIVNF